jgi:uncharacterized protein (DUF983 family)
MAGPFDDLDPEEPRDFAPPPRPTPTTTPGEVSRAAREGSRDAREGARTAGRSDPGGVRAFSRGAARRCPRCGGGRLFESWFRIKRRCPRCGLRLEREEGGFLGAMTINYAVTAIVWLAVLIVWLVIDLPDVNVLWLTITSIAVAIVVPLLFWPFSKTIWAVVDYLVYRTDPEYASREAADRASGNGGRA